MDTLEKLGKGNAQPATRDNVPIYREDLNKVVDKVNEVIGVAVTNEGDESGTPITHIVHMSQEDYDALSEVDPNTLYVTI